MFQCVSKCCVRIRFIVDILICLGLLLNLKTLQRIPNSMVGIQNEGNPGILVWLSLIGAPLCWKKNREDPHCMSAGLHLRRNGSQLCEPACPSPYTVSFTPPHPTVLECRTLAFSGEWKEWEQWQLSSSQRRLGPYLIHMMSSKC